MPSFVSIQRQSNLFDIKKNSSYITSINSNQRYYNESPVDEVDHEDSVELIEERYVSKLEIQLSRLLYELDKVPTLFHTLYNTKCLSSKRDSSEKSFISDYDLELSYKISENKNCDTTTSDLSNLLCKKSYRSNISLSLSSSTSISSCSLIQASTSKKIF